MKPIGAVLHNDAYWELARSGPLVQLTRSSLSYATVGDAERSLVRLVRAIDLVRSEGVVMLLDTRDAKGTQDPEIEALIGRYTPLMTRGFNRVAVLLSTAAGLLQSQRIVRQNGWGDRMASFLREEDAFAYLGDR